MNGRVPQLLIAASEIDAVSDLLESILSTGKRNGPYLEILSCLISIDFQWNSWTDFLAYKKKYLLIGGDHIERGWNRATRVYTNEADRPTKPSYLKRFIAYPDRSRKMGSGSKYLNQVEKISFELAKKPGFSNLSFVVLRPADLHDQFRPGYVPCLVAGDFKFRDGKLDLNVFFRTSDALSVFFADVYYTRRLQMQILNNAKTISKSKHLENAEIGKLNIYLSRAYISKKLKNKQGIGSDGLEIAKRLIDIRSKAK